MSKKYKNNINTIAGFTYNAEQPLDDRDVVETYSDLNTLILENMAYEGIEVYVIENKKSYKLINSNWEPVASEEFVNHKIEELNSTIQQCKNTNIINGEPKNSLEQIKDANSWNSSNKNVLNYVKFDKSSSAVINDDDRKINGTYNVDSGIATITVGAHGDNSTMFNGKSQSTGGKSHTEGSKNIALANNSHAEGNDTFAGNQHSHAEGCGTSVLGNSGHVEGALSNSYSYAGHGEGCENVEGIRGFTILNVDSYNNAYKLDNVIGLEIGDKYSVSLINKHYDCGRIIDIDSSNNLVYVDNLINESLLTEKHDYMDNSFFILDKSWLGTRSLTAGSHVEGVGNINYFAKHVEGQYNEPDRLNEYIHVIGGGTSNTNRKNLHTVDWSGNAWFAGDFTLAPGKGIILQSSKNNHKIKISLSDDGDLIFEEV